jgi:hypothetical protein
VHIIIKHNMPNVLVEAVISAGVLIATQQIFKMYKLVGKGYTFLAVFISLVVFAYFPFAFKDPGPRAQGPRLVNDRIQTVTLTESEEDQLYSTMRVSLSFMFLVGFGIYLVSSPKW